MNVLEKLRNNRYLIWALVFALLNMGAVFLIFGFRKYSDTFNDINLIHWFQGNGGGVDMARILRPLGPLLALPFEFLGDGAGLILQNIIFYLFSAFLIFKITDLIFQNKKQAFLASIFFVTATPVIESGLAYLTDMGAWFFYLLSIFLTLIYFKTRKEGLLILNGLLSGTGVLMKENGGLGVLFFGLMILLSKEFNIKEKILKIMRFGIFFLTPVAITQILVFKYFHITSLDLYLSGKASLNGEGLLLVFLRYFGQLFRILGILWIFFFIGLWEELKIKNWERIKIYLALIPSSLSFFLWSIGAGGRAVFIFAPLGILLATCGCKKIRPLPMVLIILVILVLNYSFVLVNQEIPFTDIIYTLLFSR